MSFLMNLFILFSCFLIPGFQSNSIISSDNSSITIKGEYYEDGYLYSYGFIRYLDTNETNGVLIKTDVEENKIIFQIQYDIGYDEMFLFLADVGDDKFAIVNKNSLTYSANRMNEFVSTEVLIYDSDGFFITKTTMTNMPTAYGNMNHRLFLQCEDLTYYLDNKLNVLSQMVDLENLTYLSLQYQGSAYIDHQAVDEIILSEPGIYLIDITDTLYAYHQLITVYPSIVGVEDGGIYTSELTITSNGEIYINGRSEESPVVIFEPGNYILTVYGLNDAVFELSFVYDFSFEGIEDQDETSDCIIVSSNASQMTIDGFPYPGNMFCDVGKHELEMMGIGDYTKTISFSILPKIDGVHNYEEFTEAITIFAHGEAYLNGVLMSEETTVSETGNYLIEVMYDGEIYEQIFFTLRLPNEEEPILSTSNNYIYEIVLGILTVVGIYMIIKKK